MRRFVAGMLRVWRRDVFRLRPSGLFAWSYLLGSLPPALALHRVLWWHSRNRLPRLLWLPLEGFRILYWRCIGHKRALTDAVRVLGGKIAHTEDIPIEVQRARIRVWAVRWCIAPSDAYRFGLYRDGKDGLSRLYASELQPYQRFMNAKRGARSSDYRIVQDKQRLAERLAGIGMPVAVTVLISDGNGDDLVSALSETEAVFCKLRFGSRGESAFMAESSSKGLIGQTLAGKLLENEAAVLAAWNMLAGKGPVLIQPYLRNHSLLQGLSPGADSITLRVITRMQGDSASVWMGLLYVQAPGDSQEREYWLLKIDAESGQAFDAFGHWHGQESEINDCAQLLMLDGQAMPFWKDIASHSGRAHAQLPRVWAIAWDWIVTPDGPVLLEGNAGWDLSPLQELGVDFVQLATQERL